MRISVFGKPWSLLFVAYVSGTRAKRGRYAGGDHGSCSRPDKAPREIKIRGDLAGRRLLDVLIHELTHAANWHIDEDHVNRFASDVARTLTRREVWQRIVSTIESDLH